MVNVSFLGAGSFFVDHLARDIFQIPGVREGVLHLVDIDEARLARAAKVTELIAQQLGGHWKVSAHTDRRAALPNCDYVINCIEVAGVETVRHDNDIPLKYGVSQCIGDTIGPGGLFKVMRTGPVWEDVLYDCEELCPEALVLNYTNPMNMMCLIGQWSSSMRVVGLCHSVQGSSGQLAAYTDTPYDELDFMCAGINHHAWFTRLEHKGRDLYPVLKERLAGRSGELWEKDPVRFDMMLNFGYFVTESSGHYSEYVPYYRKQPEHIRTFCREKYLGEEGFYANNWPTWRDDADARRDRILAGDKDNELTLERSNEYASYIIEAIETNKPTVIHGNVANEQLIDNLPDDGCVEVACLVDRNGVQPTKFGPLPPQCAALCRSNMGFFELGATAVLERSKEAALHALMLDPLTSAVCTLDEIRAMFDELYEAEREYLPDYL